MNNKTEVWYYTTRSFNYFKNTIEVKVGYFEMQNN